MPKGLALVLRGIGLTNIIALAGLKRTKLNATSPSSTALVTLRAAEAWKSLVPPLSLEEPSSLPSLGWHKLARGIDVPLPAQQQSTNSQPARDQA